LRKEPGERYAQVADLHADVARYVRGAPVGARAHARWYPLTHGMRRHRWAIAGGAIAFAVLLTGLLMIADRATRITETRTIALVGFENLSRQERDSWLGAALTEMFGTDLSNAESLSVVPDELVRDVVKGMHTAGAGSFGPDTLLRLGHQLGADYVVSGNYLVAPTAGDSSLRIDIAVQEVKSGHSLTRFSQQANLADLSDLVRQIGSTVRVKLGVPADAGPALAQLASALPPSVDVARLMGIAYDAMEHYDAGRARDALLQVIAEAPGYAPAYAALSEAWFALGYRDKAVASAEQSLAHGAGLSQEMQTRIDATLQTAKYQWDKAAADWQALIDLRPGNPEYRLKFIDASIAAANVPAAKAQLAQLRELPEAGADPRVELAAAHIARSLDDSKACAEHAESAMVLAAAIEAPGLAADARDEFATAQTHLGNLDVAEVGFRAVIAAYQALGNPRGEADARRNLASVQADQHHVEVARAEYNRAMTIDQGIGDRAGVAAIYRNMTEMLWDGGDRDGAQAAASRALEIARDTGDLKLQAWTLRALATIASDEAASDDVMRDYEAVTALTERSGDLGGHVWSLVTVADFARMRGEIQQARNICAQGLMEAGQLTDPQFTVYAMFTCALVEMDGGAPDKAVAMFRQVETLTQNGESSMYGTNTRLMLAQIDMESARCPQAIEKLNRVIVEFKAAEAKSGEANAEAMRAICQHQLGDTAARDAALARAKTLRRTVTSRQEVYFVDIAIAQLATVDSTPLEAIARLSALSTDAERRHWLGWSLEAKLAAWQLARGAWRTDRGGASQGGTAEIGQCA
jgi:tetratricopeptide (TPR) repeat protein